MQERVVTAGPIRVVALLWLSYALIGCATRGLVTNTPAPPDPVIEATPLIVTPDAVESVAEMFERAYALLSKGHAREAAEMFEVIIEADVGDKYAPTAAFNAGLARELAGDHALALARFEDARQRAPEGQIGKLAAIRAMRLNGLAEAWGEASDIAGSLLARRDLNEVERLEALGAKALGLVQSDDFDAAEKFVSQGRDLIEELGLGASGQLPLAVAQLQFALGEVRRLRSEQIRFVPLPSNFSEALEHRCQGLLDAQSAYTDAMRSLDPHWAAMSGYRVGQLYQRLHADIVAISPPAQADTTDKRLLFEGAMRLRYRVLLEKGLKMMDHTISLGERTGQAASWIARARQARDELLQSLAEEKASLSLLPFSEQDLQRALDDLEKQKPPSS